MTMSWIAKKYRKPKDATGAALAAQDQESKHATEALLTPSESSDTTRVTDNTCRYGLLRLGESKANDISEDSPCNLDIVAIHGLNGGPYSTWTKGKGPLWLQKDLPQAVPGARVYTYGYDSRVWSASKGEIRDWARTLLNCLRSQRKTEKEQKRGIIFICHSLGGIVCKRALIEANEDPAFFNILKSTKAIIFFGTPHVGSEQADFASMLGLIAESLSTVTLTDRITGQRVRRDLVHLLKNQSKELEEISTSFRNRIPGIEIVSFYEQDTIKGFKNLIVPRKSALINCPGEYQFPSPGKDHRTMCQLDAQDDEYISIVEICKKFMDGPSKEDALLPEEKQFSTALQEFEWQDRRFHEKDTEKQQKCLAALRSVELEMMDRRAHLATPIPGTCDWILSYPRFREWISGNRSDVLHLTGDMGSGKTTMMSFLANNQKAASLDNKSGINSKPFTVCSFFCSHQHHNFRDAVWILRGILYQLLEQNENLLRFMNPSIASLGDIPAENWNQSLLWPRLEDALNSALTGPVLLIIDALDECAESSTSLFLENIGKLFGQRTQDQSNCVKLLVSSRPSINLGRNIQHFTTPLSVDTEEVFESLQQDIQHFISYEITRLATAGRWSLEMKSKLESELRSKSGVSFLWARLVLNRMENGSQDMLRLRKVIDESPKDLDQFYCHILEGIDDDNQDLAAKMLRVLVGSMRPLTTKEFRMALAIISSGHQSLPLEEIENARDRNIKQSIRNVLKSLAYVRGNKVQLYHLSTKEFLLRLSEGKVNNLDSFGSSLRRVFGVDLHTANLDLARACITFLGLDDFNEDMDRTQDEALLSFAELPAYDDVGDEDQFISTSLDALPSPSLSASCSEDEPDGSGALSVKEKIQKHMFYAYSATFWASHLRLVGPFATQELLESSIHISDPSENCLMHWSDLYRSSSQEWVGLPTPLDPLIISAFFGVVSLGKEVLKQSIGIEEKNKSLSLCWASRMGHADVVEMLIAHQTQLNGRRLDGRWPLSWACANGHLKIVQILLKEDRKQINLLDGKNRSLLSLAVEFGDMAVTKLLLSIDGINPNLEDIDGCTPIHWSVGSKMGQDDIKQLKKLLTVNNIDIAKRDKRGRTVLSWAAEKGALKAIDVLLQSKHPGLDALLNDTGDAQYGRSPIGYAAFYGHFEVVEALCKTGKVNAQLASVDHKGQNAVVLAADRNNWEVVQVFAKHYPAGLDVPDQDGRTPLSAAMWADDNENNAKTIRMLIKSGVDVNKKSHGGRSPLAFAAAAGRVSMIRILVEEGHANMDITDNNGLRPENCAVEANEQAIREEFRRLRALQAGEKD